LAATYPDRPVIPRTPPIEALFTMQPPPAAAIAGIWNLRL
jgi:hypothetical protein